MMRSISLVFVLLFCSFFAHAQLRSVNAVLSGKNVVIQWVVDAYQTCDEVVVQHSTDSIYFNDIYSYPGVCGGSSVAESYQFKHSSPSIGANYYRLYLGKYGYTQVIRVTVTGNPAGLQVAPNPFNESTKISLINEGKIYDVIILDMKGNIIRMDEKQFQPEFIFYRKLLNAGLYYLIITDYRSLFTYAKIVIRDDY
jgi:hypothetical protein